MNHEQLRKYYIGPHTVVYTNSVHRFGTDGVLLADFAAPKKNDKALELGTGCGIISLIWCRNEKPDHIDALEIQEDAVDLVKRAISENGIEDRLRIVHGDLRVIEQFFQKGFYDLVVMNPPYKKAGDGIITPNEGLAIARHELRCDLDDICQAASLMLNAGGRFCLCQRPGRLSEVLCSMHETGIEPKRLRFVQQRATSTPGLFLVEGKKGANEGLVVEPPLILEHDADNMTEEVIAIYGEYYEQKGRNQ